MSKIIKMDDALAHLIAAGEVVDRPASVIKELVENSIDAKATHIQVFVNNLGLDKIVVIDNGFGMDKEDLHLAFLAHATSKIKTSDDLQNITTLGFRGEAIPSIASVSKMTIASRSDDNEGYYVTYHQTKCVSEGAVALNRGTKITVEDLFYNTPARFKYLKSEHAERQTIVDLFDKLALSHPEISFSLTMEDKLIKQTPGNGLMNILIDEIFGKQVASDAKYFECEIAKIKVKGYLFSHHLTRSKKKDIHLFINSRSIRNYALTQAVINGYHTLLMSHRYPMAIIYLTIDPQLIDVNVHPQKLEVKLANELLLAHQLEYQIKINLEYKNALNQSKTGDQVISEPNNILPKEFEHLSNQAGFFEFKPPKNFGDPLNEPSLNQQTQFIPNFDYIGTLGGTYLLFQNSNGLHMIDQHAAAERIRYEEYYEKLGQPTRQTINLLIPRELKLTKSDHDNLNYYQKMFDQLGFIFNEGLLLGHPSWLKEKEIDLVIETMVNMISTNQVIDVKVIRDQLAKDISCKGAIKANQQLSSLEIEALLNGLKGCKNPFTCPHGRPILIKLSFYEIEKLFKRIV